MATFKEIFVFSFDLEKAFPKLATSVAYYNVRLDNWRSRRSQEILSCLIKYITTYAKKFEKIITYLNSCVEQNRNIKTVLSLLKLIQRNKSWVSWNEIFGKWA